MTGERDAGFVRIGADEPVDTDVVVDLVDEVAALDRLREHLADGHLLAGHRLENGNRLEFDLPRPGPHPDPMHVDRERVVVEVGDDIIEPGAILELDEHGLLVGRPDPDVVADALIEVAADADALEQLGDAIDPRPLTDDQVDTLRRTVLANGGTDADVDRTLDVMRQVMARVDEAIAPFIHAADPDAPTHPDTMAVDLHERGMLGDPFDDALRDAVVFGTGFLRIRFRPTERHTDAFPVGDWSIDRVNPTHVRIES